MYGQIADSNGCSKIKNFNLFSKKLEKLIYKNSDKIIALSEDMKNKILNTEPYPDKVTTIATSVILKNSILIKRTV